MVAPARKPTAVAQINTAACVTWRLLGDGQALGPDWLLGKNDLRLKASSRLLPGKIPGIDNAVLARSRMNIHFTLRRLRSALVSKICGRTASTRDLQTKSGATPCQRCKRDGIGV